MENVVAILTAAGSGTRLKEKLPKTLVSLSEESTAAKNTTIVELALSHLLKVDQIKHILITVPTQHTTKYEKIILSNDSLRPLFENGRIHLVAGGVSRQNSIYKALVYWEKVCCRENSSPVFDNTKLVEKNCLSENLYKNTALLIHDAARCFTQPELIENLIKVFYEKLGYNEYFDSKLTLSEKESLGKKLDCEQYKTVSQKDNENLNFGVIPVLPINDTVKIIKNFDDKNRQNSQTVDRKQYFRVQTPQIFSLKHMLNLHKENKKLGEDEKLSFTDDASMLEKNNGHIYHILGDELSFKITTPLDLVYAKCLYNKQFN